MTYQRFRRTPLHRTTILVAHAFLLALLVVAAPAQAVDEIFSDDFNRPDGPLGDPWSVLDLPLFIENQRVVADVFYLGNMVYDGITVYPDASLEFNLNFAGDQDDGRYHLYIVWGTTEEDAVGFSARVGAGFVSLKKFFPEEEIAYAPYPFDAHETYHAKLAYDSATDLLTLVLRDSANDVVQSISAVSTFPQAGFHACAMAIENLADAAKWLDNLVFVRSTTPTGVQDEVPGPGYRLTAAPNPFNPQITIRLMVDRAQRTEVMVYDLAGRLVRRLLSDVVRQGSYQVAWDGRDEAGMALASGSYIVRLVTEEGLRAEKVTLIR